MDTWRDQVQIHGDEGFVLTGFVARNKVGYGFKVILPHAIALKMILMGLEGLIIVDIYRRPRIRIFAMPHGPSDMRNVHAFHHLEGDTILGSAMHRIIIHDITDIVEIHPRFEVVLFSPHDLSNDKLKKDSAGGSTNVTLFNVINASIAVAGVMSGLNGGDGLSSGGNISCIMLQHTAGMMQTVMTPENIQKHDTDRRANKACQRPANQQSLWESSLFGRSMRNRTTAVMAAGKGCH
jgi:hypothetical protein